MGLKDPGAKRMCEFCKKAEKDGQKIEEIYFKRKQDKMALA